MTKQTEHCSGSNRVTMSTRCPHIKETKDLEKNPHLLIGQDPSPMAEDVSNAIDITQRNHAQHRIRHAHIATRLDTTLKDASERTHIFTFLTETDQLASVYPHTEGAHNTGTSQFNSRQLTRDHSPSPTQYPWGHLFLLSMWKKIDQL